MPANTVQGYPYPLPTEPVAEGAQAIRNLAEAIMAPRAVVTTLPASPIDGQEVNFLADAALGIVWRLRYRAASSSSYKWEFVGGSPIALTGSAQFAAMNLIVGWRVLPAVTIAAPRAGEYHVWGGARLVAPAAGSRQLSASVVKVAGAGPGAVGNALTALVAATISVGFALPEQRFTATAAADSFTIGASDNSINDSNAFWLTTALVPIRLG